MTELSGFWTTSGTPSGHQQASYSQIHWSTAAKILAACKGFEGVAPGYLNNLAGTVTGANTVAINTGGGIVDGKWYNNDASLNVNIPSAVGGGYTRIDRIVLRCSWSGFACQVYRIAGTDAASPTVPAITQTPGTTYDIKLYQALVDTGGTVTLTDERIWTGDLPLRQGGSATVWGTNGSTNYASGKHIQQSGSALSDAGGSITVTFPIPFLYTPIIFATAIPGGGDLNDPRLVNIYSISATQVTFHTYNPVTGAQITSVYFYWLAIGPVA